MPSPILYLFDIDGTLIRSPRGIGRRSFEAAVLEVAGVAEALDGVILHGNTDLSILDEAFRLKLGRPATSDEVDRVLTAYVRLLAAEVGEPDAVRVLPSVEATLDTLAARGALIGLATGNIRAGARLKLDSVGLWRHFPFGGFGSDAAERADLVKVAIVRAEERVGHALSRDAIWVIGDTPRDISAAHAAGVRAVGVATGVHDVAALLAAGADRVHPTLEPFLEKLSEG